MTKEEKRQLMRKWRLAANEKLKDMSVFLNVPASSLCQIEMGRANMRDEVFYRYAERYGKINTDIVMESKLCDNNDSDRKMLENVYAPEVDDHEKHAEDHKVFSSIKPVDIKPYAISNPNGHEQVKTKFGLPLPPANKIDKIYEAVMEQQKKMNEMHALLKSIFE